MIIIVTPLALTEKPGGNTMTIGEARRKLMFGRIRGLTGYTDGRIYRGFFHIMKHDERSKPLTMVANILVHIQIVGEWPEWQI